jgi:hypothetical protein
MAAPPIIPATERKNQTHPIKVIPRPANIHPFSFRPAFIAHLLGEKPELFYNLASESINAINIFTPAWTYFGYLTHNGYFGAANKIPLRGIPKPPKQTGKPDKKPLWRLSRKGEIIPNPPV